MPRGITNKIPYILSEIYTSYIDVLGPPIASALFIPLIIEEQIIGYIGVGHSKLNAFQKRDEAFLRTIAEIISIVVNNRELLKRERREREISDTLREISAVLVSSLQLDTTLAIILESLEKLLDFDSAAIFLFTPNNHLKMVGGRGMPYAEITIASSAEINRFSFR